MTASVSKSLINSTTRNDDMTADSALQKQGTLIGIVSRAGESNMGGENWNYCKHNRGDFNVIDTFIRALAAENKIHHLIPRI